MAKLQDRRVALELRKQGLSYAQIRKKLNVSKSTLSIWLRHLPLTKDQISDLRDNNQVRIEKFRKSMMLKRRIRWDVSYNEGRKLLPLSERELYFCGLMLYWGEGNKAHLNTVSVTNTDPSVLVFTVNWFIHSLKVPFSKIKCILHLYSDMNIERELDYWSSMLGIPVGNFVKSYIKSSKRELVDHKGFGHGTCTAMVHDTLLKERIMMGIKSISDTYGKNWKS